MIAERPPLSAGAGGVASSPADGGRLDLEAVIGLSERVKKGGEKLLKAAR